MERFVRSKLEVKVLILNSYNQYLEDKFFGCFKSEKPWEALVYNGFKNYKANGKKREKLYRTINEWLNYIMTIKRSMRNELDELQECRPDKIKAINLDMNLMEDEVKWYRKATGTSKLCKFKKKQDYIRITANNEKNIKCKR